MRPRSSARPCAQATPADLHRRLRPLFQGADARPAGGAADPCRCARGRPREARATRRRGAACRAGAARSGLGRTTEAARPHPPRACARGRSRPPAAPCRTGIAKACHRCCRRAHSTRCFWRPSASELYARIDARFGAMLDTGALDEVAAAGGAAARPVAAGHEGPWRAGADPPPARRRSAGRRPPRSAAPTPATTPSASSPGFATSFRNSNGWSRRGRGCGWRAASPVALGAIKGLGRPQHARLPCRVAPRKNARRTAGTPLHFKNRENGRPCLDIRALAAMFAQPLGRLGRLVRNIITKLLIAVVPGHTAGDG